MTVNRRKDTPVELGVPFVALQVRRSQHADIVHLSARLLAVIRIRILIRMIAIGADRGSKCTLRAIRRFL